MPDIAAQKAELRKQMRAARLAHVRALPPQVTALLFRQPPVPVLDLVPDDAVIGLYRAIEDEAPAANYARFFQERGHRIALPRLLSSGADMVFAVHTDPWEESDLAPGPHGLFQPGADAEAVKPGVIFVPLLAFTAAGERMGQGGGYYDRYLAAHAGIIAIGIAWDVQVVDALPLAAHDRPLAAIVTPTRIYGPFA